MSNHNRILALLVGLFLLGGCDGERTSPPSATASLTAAPKAIDQKIRLGSWNIENLGPSYLKPEKRPKLTAIVKIVAGFDIVAIQEVSDKDGKIQPVFEQAVRDQRSSFRMLLSPRTGLQKSDKKGQEQYAILYDSQKFTVLDGIKLYDDSRHDDFSREPANARFKVIDGGWTFILVNIHTDPDEAPAEIEALTKVFAYLAKAYPEEDDVLVVGDYNAGTNSVKPARWNGMKIRDTAKYQWIIPDSADTTTATKGDDQSHDRMVYTVNQGAGEWTGEWGVMKDLFTTEEDLSDHYPIWATFWSNER